VLDRWPIDNTPEPPSMERTAFLAAIALAGVMSCAALDPVSAQDNKMLGETLSAGERTEFVKEVVGGCLESQRTAPENKGLSQDVIDSYCRCTAERMVDGFTAAEIDKIVESVTPELQARIDRIEQACVPKPK
jgi:hypothetical protein